MNKWERMKVAALASKGINGLIKIYQGLPVLREEAKIAEKVAKDI